MRAVPEKHIINFFCLTLFLYFTNIDLKPKTVHVNTGSRLVLPLVVFTETNFHSHVKVMESSTGLNKRPKKKTKINTFIKHRVPAGARKIRQIRKINTFG